MLLFGIWILLVFEGTFGNETFCATDSYTTCAPPNTFPLNIPENETELDRSCSIVSEYMPCVKNHELTCKGSFKYEEDYNRVYGTLRKMCDKGSPLHKKLAANIKCIKKVIYRHNETCFQDQQATARAYRLYLNKEIGEESEELTPEELDVLFCLEHSTDIGCFLRNVEECGSEAKTVSLEIVKFSGFNLDGCPDEVLKTAILLLRHLELEYYQEILIREVLFISEENKYSF